MNTDVKDLRYNEAEELWEATLVHMVPGTGDMGAKQRERYVEEHGREAVYLREEKVKAKIVISGVGGLVEPKEWPDNIPGRETFKGEIFHTARWRDDIDLNGKDVVVVGTGCSAAQVVPGILEKPYNVKSVTQLMRSPPWTVPKPEEPFGRENYAKHAPSILSTVPGLGRAFRILQFSVSESDWFRLFKNTNLSIKGRQKTEAKLLEHMRNTVPKKYHRIMTPNYGVGCKRRIFDAGWFESMNDDKFHITTQRLKSIQPNSITVGASQTYPPEDDKQSTEEATYPADVIILANGFDVSNFLHPLKVYGKNGVSLHDVWESRGGPQAYMGTAMDGFPNFFIIFGPNTATGHSSVVYAIECMVGHALKFIKPILKGEANTVEVKKEAEISWTNRIQEELKDTIFNGGCSSWYYSDDGWNATGYP